MSSTTQDHTERRNPEDGILVVENLVKEFGGLVAVDNLSFTLKENEILGIIGPNGAGKSTTFNCIMGTLEPTSGQVHYRADDITNVPTYKLVQRGIVRSFQDFRPLQDHTVAQNIEIGYLPNKIFSFSRLGGESREKARKIARRVGLEDNFDRTPDELPHADMLRLEIARSLATDPELLLLDEPFAGLSYQEVQEISDLLLELRDDGLSIAIIDHNMRGLLELVDRVIVIHFGSLLAVGTPEEITSDPQVQEAYLGTLEI